MNNARHIRHSHRHFGISYPISLGQRIYSTLAVPLGVIVFSLAVFGLLSITPAIATQDISLPIIWLGLLATFGRLLAAFVLALLAAVPIAVFIGHNPVAERVLFPLFDVIQSIPVLAFFPVIIWFFLKFSFFDGAAIFVLFMTMLWNIVFTMVGGMKMIPADIKAASQVFGIRGIQYIATVLLPAVLPEIITGSLLAWGQGWTIIIVAEALHNYVPAGTTQQDLFGIGSILVQAAAEGRNTLLMASLIVLVVAIAFLNFFVWQNLLRYAEKYKFD